MYFFVFVLARTEHKFSGDIICGEFLFK